MQKTRRLFPSLLISVAVASMVIAGSAAANNDAATEDSPDPITSAILLPAEEPRSNQRWLHSEIRTRKGHGLEYNRSLAVDSGKKVIFAIQGPRIKKRTPGLVFELRF